VAASNNRLPNDPDPQAAERIARERTDELAAQLSTAELVHHHEAVAVLAALENCTPDPIPDEVLLLACPPLPPPAEGIARRAS